MKHLYHTLILLLLIVTSCEKDELIVHNIPKGVNSIVNSKDTISENQFKSLHPEKINEVLELDETDLSNEILTQINNYRNQKGLKSLINNKTAKIEALRHSLHQAKSSQISHLNSNSRASALYVLEEAYYYGENVGFGYTEIEKLIEAWINSEKHKTCIEWDFTHTGIGTIYSDKGVLFYTQVFFK